MFFYVSDMTGRVVQLVDEDRAAELGADSNLVVFQADLTVEGVA